MWRRLILTFLRLFILTLERTKFINNEISKKKENNYQKNLDDFFFINHF